MMPHSIDRSHCRAARHGTKVAFDHHGCRCRDAVRLHNHYGNLHRAGRVVPAYIDATGTQRRIRALQALGYPLADLADRLGFASASRDALNDLLRRPRVTRRNAARVADLYAHLASRPGPSEQARQRARRKGWASPVQWGDIDRDAAPEPEPAPAEQEVIDEEEIRRAALGLRAYRDMRHADRRETARRLAARGMTVGAIARRMQTRPRMISQLLANQEGPRCPESST